jgi:hypothetical protein
VPPLRIAERRDVSAPTWISMKTGRAATTTAVSGRPMPGVGGTPLLDSSRRFGERRKIVSYTHVALPLWTRDSKLLHLGNQSGTL